jgi:hypothetical protein
MLSEASQLKTRQIDLARQVSLAKQIGLTGQISLVFP